MKVNSPEDWAKELAKTVRILGPGCFESDFVPIIKKIQAEARDYAFVPITYVRDHD